MPFRANHPEIAICLGVPFNLPEPFVLYKGEYAAPIAASIAEGGDTVHRCLLTGVGPPSKVEQVMAQGKGTYCCSRCL